MINIIEKSGSIYGTIIEGTTTKPISLTVHEIYNVDFIIFIVFFSAIILCLMFYQSFKKRQ